MSKSLKQLAIEAFCLNLVSISPEGAITVVAGARIPSIPLEIAHALLLHLRTARLLTLDVFKLFNHFSFKELSLVLDFTNAGPVVPAGLRRAQLVSSVSSTSQARLNDLWLDEIAASHPGVTSLDLTKGYSLSDAGVARMIPRLTRLEVLRLDKAKKLTDQGLLDIHKLTRLHTLGLAATATTSALIPAILTLTSLTSLNLASVLIIDDSLTSICRSLTNLRSLVIKACISISNESFTDLQALKHLHTLDAQFTLVTSEGLIGVEKLVNLTSLNLGVTSGIDSGAAKHFSGLQALTDLNLASTEFGDFGMAGITKCQALRALRVDKCPISPLGFGHLLLFSNLTLLSASWTRFDDDCVQYLANSPEITHLKLTFCPITDVGIARLTALSRLVALEISGRHISNAAAASLIKFPFLDTLCLWETTMDAQSAATIPAALPRLQRHVMPPTKVGTYLWRGEDTTQE